MKRHAASRARPRSSRSTVYGYLSDSARFAAWWGKDSTIAPRVGGKVLGRFVKCVECGGVVTAGTRDRLYFQGFCATKTTGRAT